ncbi:MAG: NrfD/PsrC family molybdoenzyme membrane anchor subunit [Saprospiraceae bacterium]
MTKEHRVDDSEMLSKYSLMEKELLRPIQKIGTAGKIWIAFLLFVCLMGAYAFFLQETKSKYETISLTDYTMWGVYISNFVFYVALSLIGVLMSAVLKLTNFEWYRPIARIAEVIAVGAIMFAGISIVVAMGRPERLYLLLTQGRIQSPIVWDVIVVVTYLVLSCLFLFIPLIPEITMCRDRLQGIPKWQMWIYRNLSFGWKGKKAQWNVVKRSVKILAVLVIPVGISIHTVTAWLFASTLRAEWDSTNFGAYFVSGAFLLGVASIIIATFMFRKFYNLEKYLTEYHFDRMGHALVFFSFVYLYFNINEYFVPAFKMSSLHANHLMESFTGDNAWMFWLVGIFGIIVPGTLPLIKRMRKPLPLTIIAILAFVSAWFKRYIIVIPGLAHPYLPIQDVPHSWTHYMPSVIEMTIVFAIFSAFLLFVTLFSRFFPIISIWEVAEGEGVNIERIHDNDPIISDNK